MGVTIEDRLKKLVNQVRPDIEVDGIDSREPLTAQGMDSLDVVDYVLKIETELGVKVENETFDDRNLDVIKNMVVYLSELGIES
jgi:acyl carrier protein